VRDEIERRFVVVHVNYSKENKNATVLEKLGNPDKLGFPVLVVLSPALEVLHTQETGSLETGDPKTPGHDPARVIAFARSWGPDGEH
jgi:hypothetical protein